MLGNVEAKIGKWQRSRTFEAEVDSQRQYGIGDRTRSIKLCRVEARNLKDKWRWVLR